LSPIHSNAGGYSQAENFTEIEFAQQEGKMRIMKEKVWKEEERD
jgi:hypothetical protein